MSPTPSGAPAGDEIERVRRAVACANIPTLLMTLVHLTGDLRWIEEPYRPTRAPGIAIHDSGGLDESLQDEIREAAAIAIAEATYRPAALPTPSRELLHTMMQVSVGEDVPTEYGDLLAGMLDESKEELTRRLRAVVPPGTSVLIVGAGASGLCAAVRLGQAGLDCTIVERSGGLGGTWRDNRYPGCGVDTPSHLYSFSFAPNDWSRYFAKRDEILSYLDGVADTFDLRRRTRFNTEVLDARWVAEEGRWQVRTRDSAGTEQVLHADLLISGVGAFGSPVVPHIEGLEDFRGAAMHTAQWDPAVEVAGKRVGVVGNGASAMQVVPAVAGVASSVSVFQRSPQWISPLGGAFAGEVPDDVRWLIATVHYYRIWLRAREAWIFNDKAYPATVKDPGWEHPERSLNRASDRLRSFLTRYLESELEDRGDLVARTTPSYPPFGKRMLFDHGWYRALRREDVELVTEPIARIEADGIRSTDGTLHPLDVLVFATGFDVVRFVSSYEVRGRDGLLLREEWDGDDARAYLGLAVAGFPNFFTLYGPNTQAGHGGSLLFAVEAQIEFVIALLTATYAAGATTVEVSRAAYDAYTETVDAQHARMVWTHPGMSTYYRNGRGRIVVNSPWQVIDYWHRTRSVDLGDFVLSAPEAAASYGEAAAVTGPA